MQQWILLAVAAMVLFSFSNLALKSVLIKVDLAIFKPLLIPLFLAFLVFVLTSLYVSSKAQFLLSKEIVVLLVAVVIFSLVGFALFLKALESGDAALVTAILSLSTVVIAGVSVAFLGVQYSGREFAAMALALISLLTLIL